MKIEMYVNDAYARQDRTDVVVHLTETTLTYDQLCGIDTDEDTATVRARFEDLAEFNRFIKSCRKVHDAMAATEAE